ncbi:hypothetical protein NEOLEDRAFT_1142911 [Neolentinus lepideus HHB14362 ss-1]|uniref:Uncharacterized protein n=1 Tax=Neolentinus lepideus HHB14362 ss-1 TaxID=1314782 RepID=A0A165MUM5_9AGAM|nr:hypothetical protein NEOLEDRAFT_1142911 [Neolentinus lepideus HHB14362 ss-1]
MAAAPPVPPRPFSASSNHDNKPPVPPLPPNFQPDDRSYSYTSAPHFETPLAAPRPTRADPDAPANVRFICVSTRVLI